MSHVNVIHILRSGKEVDNYVVIPNQDPPVSNQSFSPLVDKSKESNSDHQSSTINKEESETTTERVIEPPVPYPNRLRPKKHSAQVEKTLELFKQVKVNIPLLDVIEQVPSYARFLKDLCTRKRKTPVPKKVFMASPISDMVSSQMPEKHRDPGCPTITCTIGSTIVKRALLDLGAGMNLLPYYVYQQLGI
jgi:hypothetical protein